MGNECVGSLSPQADLLGFAVAILLAASLAVLISQSVQKHEDSHDQDITAEDVRSILDWPGFDPDGDGKLSFPREEGILEGAAIGARGRIVALLCIDDEATGYLFSEGRFGGKVSNPVPSSRVLTVTVLIDVDGGTVPGTLSVFRTREVT